MSAAVEERRVLLTGPASERAANHWHTSTNWYPRLSRCFSPDSTPGVSTSVMFSSTFDCSTEPSSLFRNEMPKRSRPR